jgi:hypothetical protein
MHRLTASVYSELSSRTLHRRRGRSDCSGLARSSRREASLGYLGRGVGCGGGGGGPGFGSVALAREVGRVLHSGCFLSSGGGSLFFVLIAAEGLRLVTCACERSGRKSAL